MFVAYFQDVAFLPSSASFYTTFLKNCSKGESFAWATCHRTCGWGKHGCSPFEIHFLKQILFMSVEFHGDNRAAIRLK